MFYYCKDDLHHPIILHSSYYLWIQHRTTHLSWLFQIFIVNKSSHGIGILRQDQESIKYWYLTFSTYKEVHFLDTGESEWIRFPVAVLTLHLQDVFNIWWRQVETLNHLTLVSMTMITTSWGPRTTPSASGETRACARSSTLPPWQKENHSTPPRHQQPQQSDLRRERVAVLLTLSTFPMLETVCRDKLSAR